MILLILIFSELIIVTKFADCFTTSVNICNNPNLERNPIARILMKKFGIQNSIRIIFLFTIIITITITISAFISVIDEDSMLYNILFIVIALIISIVQILAALHNHTKEVSILNRVISWI